MSGARSRLPAPPRRRRRASDSTTFSRGDGLMRVMVRGWQVRVAAAVVMLGAASAGAQRAGESGGAIDSKSGRFLNEFSRVPARAPDTLAVSAERVFAAL